MSEDAAQQDRFVAVLASEAYRKQDEVGQLALLLLASEAEDVAARLTEITEAMEAIRVNRGTVLPPKRKAAGRRKGAAPMPHALAFAAWSKLRRGEGMPDREITPARMAEEVAAGIYSIPPEHQPRRRPPL